MITAENLSKSFRGQSGPVVALDDVTLDVADGSIAGFEWQVHDPGAPADTAWHFTTHTDSLFIAQAPGGFVQWTFSVRLHLSGTSFSGETPLPSGPRKAGQLPARATPTPATRRARAGR